MINHMFTNFYIRPSNVDKNYGAVYVEVTVNGKRATLGAATTTSGLPLPQSIMILRANWDKRNKRVVEADPQSTPVNEAIIECERQLKKLYAKHEGYDIPMTAKGVKASIRHGAKMRPSLPDLIEKFLDEKISTGVKASTVETYSYKFIPFKAFLKAEGIEERAAEEFTSGILARYKTYLIVERHNAERSADKARQVIKTLFIWARENELIQKNPLLNTRIHVDKTPNTECLTQEEVKSLMRADLTPSLRKVADCFVFCCYTGLAYKDLKGLEDDCLQIVEGKRCIVGKRNKTGTDYCIPVTRIVDDLMKKYGGVRMPLPSNQQYNALLKVLAHSLSFEINLCSHTARKTYADWCLNEICISEEATVVAMGQKDPKELRPYRKLKPKRLIAEFPDELLEQTTGEPASRVNPHPFSRIYKAS